MTQAESINLLSESLQFEHAEGRASRYRLDWLRIPVGVAVNTAACAGSGRWAVLGPDRLGLSAARYPGFAALAAAISAGARVPEVVFAHSCAWSSRAAEITELLKAWLTDERLAAQDTRLVFVTCGGLGAQTAEEIVGLAGSPVWGQVIAAQQAYPGRFALVGIDARESSLLLLPAAAATGEPQLDIRAGVAFAPRLIPVAPGSAEADALDLAGAVALVGADGVEAELAGRQPAAAGIA